MDAALRAGVDDDREAASASTYEIKLVADYAPQPLRSRLRRCRAQRAAKRLGYSHRDIISGAGHDAVYMARVAPAAMVFTPCVDGISHNEAEDMKPEWATAGANVLLHAVLEKAEVVSGGTA